MGEYTLDSIVAMLISPKSQGRPLDKMKPFASTMISFGTFVQASIPLEVEKEEQAIRDWIYGGEESHTTIVKTPISPTHYGKSYALLQKMGYQDQGSLSNNGHALVEPLSHTNGKPSKDTTRLEYGTQEDLHKCSNNFLSASDSDSDTNQSFTYSRTPMAMVGDVIPSTSLLWGEEHTISDNKVEASTSTLQDTYESNFRDRQ